MKKEQGKQKMSVFDRRDFWNMNINPVTGFTVPNTVENKGQNAPLNLNAEYNWLTR